MNVRLSACVVIGLTLAALLGACSRQPSRSPPPNRRSPSLSPSGRYVLTVGIEKGRRFETPGVWKVSISDSQGNELYKDDDSEFVGTLNVYWIWDDKDRVWLYNSDDARVWFWELQGDGWVKTNWGYGKTKETGREVRPPRELYPDYVN
jgi:hypothetical protein